MSHRVVHIRLVIITLVCACAAAAARAQSATTFVGGLKAPSKLVITNKGNLLVAESGQGPNTGRLSLVDRRTRQRRTILDGLPSGPTPEGGTSGPSGLALRGRTAYVVIGAGDAVTAGPAPGTERANPNPSSPILSSVLAVHAPANVEELTEGFALTAADHAALKGGQRLTLSNGQGDRLAVELVADFPDYLPEPRPDFADNVRVSNPFGVAVSGHLLYVNDASHNLVRVVGLNSGAFTTFASFAQLDNPLPFGPRKIDYVPTHVRLFGDQLLVTNLTGFPFPEGKAEVRRVDTLTAEQQTLIPGLTTALDVLPIDVPGDEEKFLVLQLSTNLSQNAPGRLLLFDSPTAPPATLAAPLIGPTAMARDRQTGDIFITEIFTGRVMRVSHARALVRQHYQDFLRREPDADGWNFWAAQIEECGTDASCFERKSVDVSRAFFYSLEFIALHPELHDSLRGTAAYNREFVRQCYYAYLRRTCDPEVCDPQGFNFWVTKINSRLPSLDADYNEMIRAFLNSIEYRARLGLS
jgi:hypothetical protein